MTLSPPRPSWHPASSAEGPPRRGLDAGAALAGLVAGALTVGVAELLAALLVRSGHTSGTPSPVVAVGGAFIDRTPRWLKDLAVSSFGTHDKVALLTGIAVVLALVSALAGLVAARRRVPGLLVVVALAAVAVAAVLSRPGSGWADAVPTLVGAFAGLVALGSLLDRRAADVDEGRRTFLTRTAVVAGLAVVGGGVGQAVSRAARAARRSRAAVVLPAPAAAVPAAERADLGVRGLSAMVTPAADFYRIDTALSVPQVDAEKWSLRVHGLVDQEVTLSFAELLQQPMVETMATLTCVSNEVGGDLIGNQVWLGWPIRELLARSRPQAGADMVLSRSVDGWTAGTPLTALTDPGRQALLAVAMDGRPLPVEHGFPVRMVVPGLYGYVSATKWVVDLEVTRFDTAEGYWTPRGWSALGPIKTESRIDVPQDGASVPAGTVAVAGVAWAQHVGVKTVEVRVDGGDWQPARLGGGGTDDTWKQWVYAWTATKGRHELQVRATDATGTAQTRDQAPPAPNGATGWHTIDVTVE